MWCRREKPATKDGVGGCSRSVAAYRGRFPFPANGLESGPLPDGLTLPCATGVNPKSFIRLRYWLWSTPCGTSPASQSWQSFPWSAHKCPRADKAASVRSRFAIKIGASLSHSLTAWTLGSQSGGGGAESTSGSDTPSPVSRLLRAVPDMSLSCGGLRGLGMFENLKWLRE